MPEKCPRENARLPGVIGLLLRFILPVTEREYLLGDLEEAAGSRSNSATGDRISRGWWREIGGALKLRFGSRYRQIHRLAGRGERGDSMFREFISDLKFGLRGMRRSPGFATVAILTLALGIGATTAIFSVIDGVLLTPAPYPEVDRIARIMECNLSRGWPAFSVSPMNYRDWRERSETCELMTAYRTESRTWTGGETPENLLAYAVWDDYQEIFGIRIALGRGLSAQDFEPESGAVAVLSHGFWQRAFGGAPDVIGTSIVLDGTVSTVIGVADAGWQPLRDADLLLPLQPEPWWSTVRQAYFLSAAARLKPGVTIDQAAEEFSSIAAALEVEYPDTNTGWDVRVDPLDAVLTGNLRPQLLVLMAAVGLLLLIACVNVANMLLARAMVRNQEIAVRLAVGAGRGRIVRQLLAESLLLAALGSLLGIVLAQVGIGIFRNWPGLLLPFQEIGFNPGVLAVTIASSLLAGLLFGLLPACGAARSDLHTFLRGGRGETAGRITRRWRHSLVIVEVALAVVLLVGSGLLLRSLQALQDENPGFIPADRLMFTANLTATRYQEADPKKQFGQETLARLRAMPGVISGALSSMLPLGGDDNIAAFKPEGQAGDTDENVMCLLYRVSEDYFRTMGTPVLAGREFTALDGPETAPVVVVSENLARRHFPNDENPVGRRIRVGGIFYEIVGIVGEVQHYTLGEYEDMVQVYLLYRQNFGAEEMTFVLQTSVPPLSLARTVYRTIGEVDSDQPVTGLQPVEQVRATELQRPRFRTLLLTCFAGAALLLAVIGLYGVMSFAVARRTHEIGVRLALGARAQSVLALIVRNGLSLVGIGIGLGLTGAYFLARLLEAMLFGIAVHDAGTFLLAPVVLLVTALMATLIPARRATRIDPVRTLGR